MGKLSGKKLVLLGERDGIPSPAMGAVFAGSGAEVAFSATECFVWTAAGAMDLQNQQRVKDIAEKHNAEDIIVLLGASDAEGAGIYAETVTAGDPTYAGPLAGVSLGLPVYHVLDPLLKAEADPKQWEDQISMMEMVLDADALTNAVAEMRIQHGKDVLWISHEASGFAKPAPGDILPRPADSWRGVVIRHGDARMYKGDMMSKFNQKKLILLGDETGISLMAMREIFKNSGASVVYAATECFVWTAAGAMDLETQKNVRNVAELYGCEDTLVILGTASTVDAANFAETVTDGDQSYTGPLARVSLRLPVYHVLDPLVKEQFDPENWERHIGVLEKKMHASSLVSIVAWKRSLYGKNVL